MKQYNQMLERVYKAMDYFQSNPNEIDKWIPEYRRLCAELDKIGKFIKQEIGRDLTSDEILHGFDGGIFNG
jgi:hypothetical protein